MKYRLTFVSFFKAKQFARRLSRHDTITQIKIYCQPQIAEFTVVW